MSLEKRPTLREKYEELKGWAAEMAAVDKSLMDRRAKSLRPTAERKARAAYDLLLLPGGPIAEALRKSDRQAKVFETREDNMVDAMTMSRLQERLESEGFEVEVVSVGFFSDGPTVHQLWLSLR